MGDSNKAPNDFFDNWNKIQSMSYKNVIELLVKRSSEKKILALIQFELDQFSENVQKDLTISETSYFLSRNILSFQRFKLVVNSYSYRCL